LKAILIESRKKFNRYPPKPDGVDELAEGLVIRLEQVVRGAAVLLRNIVKIFFRSMF
jgi:hypothetical protein